MAHVPEGTQPVPEVARAVEEINPMNQGYIADAVLPAIQVREKNGKIRLIQREDMLRVEDRVQMAEGATYPRVDFGTELTSYACEKFGAEAKVTDEERANALTSFDAERQAGMRAVGTVMMKIEDLVADLVFDTGTFTGDYTTTVGTSWSDSTAAIIEDVTDAAEVVRGMTGVSPNALILGKQAFNYLLYNDDIKDRFSNDSMLTPQQIRNNAAALFDLDYIFVGDGVKNTANAGATLSTSDFWGSGYAMVAKVAETDNPAEPAIGRSVSWAAMDETGYEVRMYREPQTRSDVLQVDRYLDHIMLDKAFGHLIDIEK